METIALIFGLTLVSIIIICITLTILNYKDEK
jgi:hypothetical protein